MVISYLAQGKSKNSRNNHTYPVSPTVRSYLCKQFQERAEGGLSDYLSEFVQLVLFHGRTIIQPRGLLSQLVRHLPVFIMDPPSVFSGI